MASGPTYHQHMSDQPQLPDPVPEVHPGRWKDASAAASWISRKILAGGIYVSDPMTDVSNGNISVELFDVDGKQFILTIQDPRP